MKINSPENIQQSESRAVAGGMQKSMQLKTAAAPATGIHSIVQKKNETVQRATSVETTSAQYKYNGGTETVGASMVAKLDPKNPKHGSSPGSGEQANLMADLKNQGYQSMIRGHLMNGQLGGPGIASNMFPITSKANSWHKYYAENHVKDAIASGKGVHYTVKVGSSFDIKTPAAKFECKAYGWDPKKDEINYKDKIVDIGINSDPQKKSKGSADLYNTQTGKRATGQGTKWALNALLNKIPFATYNLPKGWGESGSGRGHWQGSDPDHYTTS